MENISEHSSILNGLLEAETLRHKCSQVRISNISIAKLRNLNRQNRLFWLGALEKGKLNADKTPGNALKITQIHSKEWEIHPEDRVIHPGEREIYPDEREIGKNPEKSDTENSAFFTAAETTRVSNLLNFLQKTPPSKSRFTPQFIHRAAASMNANLPNPTDDSDAPEPQLTRVNLRTPATDSITARITQFPFQAAPYMPPKARDLAPLLAELCDYVNFSQEHAILKAANALYKLLSIWPFTCYNVTIAHALADFILRTEDFDFGDVQCMEQHLATRGATEYSRSLNKGLSQFYYSGRHNPKDLHTWQNFYIETIQACAKTALKISRQQSRADSAAQTSGLNKSETNLVKYLARAKVQVARPVDIARYFNVTNKTATNWLKKLTIQGLVLPNQNKERITEYSVML